MLIGDKLPTSANVMSHVKIIKDYSIARKVSELCKTFQPFNGHYTIAEQIQMFKENFDF